jgi:predicted Zn-dependent protease with MMP-like domain/Flp pilus assembly protein TadD
MSRTERLDRDLERGFAALDAGRLDDAAASLDRCRKLDRTNPDVITLAAAVAEARGDIDEAITQYRALATIFPDDVPPRLAIARLELHGAGDPEAALATLAAAFDFIDEEDDLIEAVVLKADALIATGELASARATLGELATSAIDDADLAFDLAQMCLAAEDFSAARRWVAAARALPVEAIEPADELDDLDERADDDEDVPLPTVEELRSAREAEALHLLGRVHEAAGERAEMIACWQQVLALDAAAPLPGDSISDDDLEEVVHAALSELPPEVHAKLERVPILVDELPSKDLVAEGLDPRLLGVFQGTPLPDGGDLAPTVTTIHLFRTNLLRAAPDREALEHEIRITVLHETAHYFGLDDEDLEKLGLD